MACLTQLMSIVSAFYTNASISGKIRSISGTGNLWIWRSKKIHYSPIQSYASAVVPDSFILPSQQSAILASLEKEYGVFHGLLPDLELRRSKIQNLYGFRVKVCTCRKAVMYQRKSFSFESKDIPYLKSLNRTGSFCLARFWLERYFR